MKTSELIKKLVESLVKNGDLSTNINDVSWYCESEGEEPKKIILDEIDNREYEIKVDGIPF